MMLTDIQMYAIPVLFAGMVLFGLLFIANLYYSKEWEAKYRETLKSYNDIVSKYNDKVNTENETSLIYRIYADRRFKKAQEAGFKYNHLVNKIPNTKENRDKVSTLNKKMKASNSKWRVCIKYRKPKNGWEPNQAHVKQEDALEFSLYLRDMTYEN